MYDIKVVDKFVIKSMKFIALSIRCGLVHCRKRCLTWMWQYKWTDSMYMSSNNDGYNIYI